MRRAGGEHHDSAPSLRLAAAVIVAARLPHLLRLRRVACLSNQWGAAKADGGGDHEERMRARSATCVILVRPTARREGSILSLSLVSFFLSPSLRPLFAS